MNGERMNMNFCGANCGECGFKEKCRGCTATCGNPFGGGCLAAEYIRTGGMTAFNLFKKQICREFNELQVEGLPEIRELFTLSGFYVNLAYPMPNGERVKLLRDDRVYVGTQVPCTFDDFSGRERCFGLVADTGFLLVAEYGDKGTDPEIVVLKRR